MMPVVQGTGTSSCSGWVFESGPLAHPALVVQQVVCNQVKNNLVDCPLMIRKDMFLLRTAGATKVPDDDGTVGGRRGQRVLLNAAPRNVD